MTPSPDLTILQRVRAVLRLCAHTVSGAFVAWCYALFFVLTLPGVLVLSLFWVGLPLLRGELSLCRNWAAGERRWANRLLGTDIPTPASFVPSTEGGQWRRLRELVADSTTWRSAGYLLVRTATGMVSAYVLVPLI